MTVDLRLGDCLDILPTLADKSVDAVITDPPYCSGGQFRSEIVRPSNEKYRGWSHSPDETRTPTAFYSAFSGDNKDGRMFLTWSKLWLTEAFRVTKDGGFIAVTTDWRQLPAITDMFQMSGWTWRGLLVWDKKIGRPVSGRYRNHIEYVVWGSRGGFTGNKGVYADSLYSETPPNHKDRTHTTEKPVGLLEFIMKPLSQGITILDPFMGSGTTGVAAVKSGSGFVGCELEPEYYTIAEHRIEEAQRQMVMELK